MRHHYRNGTSSLRCLCVVEVNKVDRPRSILWQVWPIGVESNISCDNVSYTLYGGERGIYAVGGKTTYSHLTDSWDAAHSSHTQQERKVSVRSATISRSVIRYSYRFNKVSLTCEGTWDQWKEHYYSHLLTICDIFRTKDFILPLYIRIKILYKVEMIR